MKIYYIANIRIPTERAHGIQIMEMCKAFADLGHDVILVVPDRRSEIKEDPFKFYDIPENFKIKRLWCLDLVRLGRIGFWIQSLTFAKSVAWFAPQKSGLFYTRDEMMAFVLNTLGKKMAWEAHMGHKNFWIRILILLQVPTIVISDGLRDLYSSMGMKRVHTAPDGADIDRFDLPLERDVARRELGLPLDKKIILYKGSLIPWKGAGTLAESVKYLKTTNVELVFIGGTTEDVENFKKDYGTDPRVVIKGNRPRRETPVYQKAADVLVIPNSAKEDISKLYTSPMKLFGYMAGGVPIAASDLPSLREILGESDAYFFEPDSAEKLAHTLDNIFEEYDEARRKAARALEKVKIYSWKKRAHDVLSFLNV